ncbi:MAG: N-acetyltransferase [Clostridia bacterium]|nr:N-acetyltransferase [Clostridia bacterium]
MEKEDLGAVLEIYRQGIETGTATFVTECPTAEEWDAGHRPDGRLVFVLDGTIVGFTALSPISQKEAYRGAAEVSIYIGEGYKRQGIGKKLLLALREEAEKCGYWTLYSSVFSTNTASLRLHETCGFRTIGYREKIAKDKFGIWQDATLMEYRNAIR